MKKMKLMQVVAALLANAATRFSQATQMMVKKLGYRSGGYTRSNRGRNMGAGRGVRNFSLRKAYPSAQSKLLQLLVVKSRKDITARGPKPYWLRNQRTVVCKLA